MALVSGHNLDETLKQRRLKMALSLHNLAKAAEVSASHLCRIEKRQRFPSARILKRLAVPLHLKEDELMFLAGYLSSRRTAASLSIGSGHLDPYVSTVLSREPIEVQYAVVAVLTVLKGVAGRLPMTSEEIEVKKIRRAPVRGRPKYSGEKRIASS